MAVVIKSCPIHFPSYSAMKSLERNLSRSLDTDIQNGFGLACPASLIDIAVISESKRESFLYTIYSPSPLTLYLSFSFSLLFNPYGRLEIIRHHSYKPQLDSGRFFCSTIHSSLSWTFDH